MIDQLVANAQKALEEYMKLDQEQIDKIVHAMALAGLDNHMRLAKIAFEETGRGVVEDKIIRTCSPANTFGMTSNMPKPLAL